MENLVALISVFGCGIMGSWASIPAGFTLKLPLIMIILLTSLGGAFSAVIVALIGEPARNWLLRVSGKNNIKDKDSKIGNIWQKYGVIGLGMIAPLIVGAHVGTAISIAFGASAKKTLLWMSIGIILWASVLSILVSCGISVFR